MTRTLTDDELIEALADIPGEWASADLVKRMLRRSLYDPQAPSVALVGRRLSRLAREGRVEKSSAEGAGIYRVRKEDDGG